MQHGAPEDVDRVMLATRRGQSLTVRTAVSEIHPGAAGAATGATAVRHLYIHTLYRGLEL